jgi:hypothetical protein
MTTAGVWDPKQHGIAPWTSRAFIRRFSNPKARSLEPDFLGKETCEPSIFFEISFGQLLSLQLIIIKYYYYSFSLHHFWLNFYLVQPPRDDPTVAPPIFGGSTIGRRMEICDFFVVTMYLRMIFLGMMFGIETTPMGSSDDFFQPQMGIIPFP